MNSGKQGQGLVLKAQQVFTSLNKLFKCLKFSAAYFMLPLLIHLQHAYCEKYIVTNIQLFHFKQSQGDNTSFLSRPELKIA